MIQKQGQHSISTRGLPNGGMAWAHRVFSNLITLHDTEYVQSNVRPISEKQLQRESKIGYSK
jgi:hypothetical protein